MAREVQTKVSNWESRGITAISAQEENETHIYGRYFSSSENTTPEPRTGNRSRSKGGVKGSRESCDVSTDKRSSCVAITTPSNGSTSSYSLSKFYVKPEDVIKRAIQCEREVRNGLESRSVAGMVSVLNKGLFCSEYRGKRWVMKRYDGTYTR